MRHYNRQLASRKQRPMKRRGSRHIGLAVLILLAITVAKFPTYVLLFLIWFATGFARGLASPTALIIAVIWFFHSGRNE